MVQLLLRDGEEAKLEVKEREAPPLMSVAFGILVLTRNLRIITPSWQRDSGVGR